MLQTCWEYTKGEVATSGAGRGGGDWLPGSEPGPFPVPFPGELIATATTRSLRSRRKQSGTGAGTVPGAGAALQGPNHGGFHPTTRSLRTCSSNNLGRGRDRQGMELLLWPWLSGALEILLPRECLVCSRPMRGGSLCFRCSPRIPLLGELAKSRCQRCFGVKFGDANECATCALYPPSFDRCRFVWEYSDLARDLIRAMKFRPSVTLARMCGDILADNLCVMFGPESWDVIVPVPASRANFRRRHFQPCFELGRRVLAKRHAPALVPALTHASRRAPQASLSHQDRLRALGSMFAANSKVSIQEKRCLLIEDVITTGATATAAALALRAAGAKTVDIASLAQTTVWPRFRRLIWEATHRAQLAPQGESG